MKNLLLLLFVVGTFFACSDASLESKLSDMEAQLAEATAKLEQVEAVVTPAPGLIHSVFFWLKEDLDEGDKAAFLQGCRSLQSISTVKNCYIGPPAPTEARDVVDNSYTFALIVHFEDAAGEKAYQVDPIHLKFVEDHKDKWTKVTVYDSLPAK